MKRKQHWEKVYKTKSDNDVGWFQEIPQTSIRLVETYASGKDLLMIEVGGGNSFLTKRLYDDGFYNLTIIDVSGKALERCRNRFGDVCRDIQWIETDILDFNTDALFQIWHDRAVFHFLIDDDEIRKYAEVAAKSIAAGGYLIIAAFSLTGPKSCSGLPITQYSEEKFCNVFSKYFKLVESFDDLHITPSGNQQNFVWAVFKRN